MAAKRDSRLQVGDIHARTVRPGCASDKRPYWQAVYYDDGEQVTAWTGRGTRAEVLEVLKGLGWREDPEHDHRQRSRRLRDRVALGLRDRPGRGREAARRETDEASAPRAPPAER